MDPGVLDGRDAHQEERPQATLLPHPAILLVHLLPVAQRTPAKRNGSDIITVVMQDDDDVVQVTDRQAQTDD